MPMTCKEMIKFLKKHGFIEMKHAATDNVHYTKSILLIPGRKVKENRRKRLRKQDFALTENFYRAKIASI